MANTETETTPTPPYLPYKTLANTLAGWGSVGVPGRIDRTLFRSFSGAIQSWLISTLRYLDLIDEAGTPTQRLRVLVAAQGTEREKVVREMLHASYAFVFDDSFDLATATAGQVADKFKSAGLQGDTVRKASALFLALAKDAGMTISPHMKVPRQRRTNGGTKPPRRKVTSMPNVTPGASSTPPSQPQPQPLTPFQVLYEMLDLEEMGEEEQSAVWTLLRYLKKGSG